MDDESHQKGHISGDSINPEMPPHTASPDPEEPGQSAEPLLKEVAETFDELAEAIESIPSPTLPDVSLLPITPEDLPGVHQTTLSVPKLTVLISPTNPIAMAKLGIVSWVLATLLLLSLQSIGVISI